MASFSALSLCRGLTKKCISHGVYTGFYGTQFFAACIFSLILIPFPTPNLKDYLICFQKEHKSGLFSHGTTEADRSSERKGKRGEEAVLRMFLKEKITLPDLVPENGQYFPCTKITLFKKDWS